MNTTRPASSVRSAWHGPKHYFGLHYDLHTTEKDTITLDALHIHEAVVIR